MKKFRYIKEIKLPPITSKGYPSGIVAMYMGGSFLF